MINTIVKYCAWFCTSAVLSGNAVFLQKQKFLHLITLDWAGEMPLGVRGDSKVCGRMCPLSLPSWNVGRVKPESFSESTWNWALQWHSANRPVGRELPTTGAWAEEAVSPKCWLLTSKKVINGSYYTASQSARAEKFMISYQTQGSFWYWASRVFPWAHPCALPWS